MGIHHSELVGLIPQEALFDAATWYLQLDGFKDEQVLENRLYEVQRSAPQEAPASQPSFLAQLAAGTATPGGGSAAAFTAAEGAALASMVARLTVGKKKYAAVETQMYELIEKAEVLRSQLTAAIQQDSAAFEALMAAMRLPKNTDEEQARRQEAVEEATLKAIAVPLQVGRLSLEAISLALEAASLGNLNAISDAASGAAFGQAALTAAGLNVQINCAGLQDQQKADGFRQEVAGLKNQAAGLEEKLKQTLRERANMQL